MAQPSVAAFFNTRKRAAIDDVGVIKNKRLTDLTSCESTLSFNQHNDDDIANIKAASLAAAGGRTRSGRAVKRIGLSTSSDIAPKKIARTEERQQQQKLVQFIKKGALSPRKKPPPPSAKLHPAQKANEATPTTNIAARTVLGDSGDVVGAEEQQRGLKTPTKQIIQGATTIRRAEISTLVRKELNFDEVKTKLTRSAKLQELKASLTRIQELEKTRKAQEERNRRLREGISASPTKKATGMQLKAFDTIELEVLTSPAKELKTPTKLPPKTPDKNELMSPRHTDVSKRLLFSPAKEGSPAKLVVPPAYQRFMSLAETSKAGQLPLPYKYRHLLEIFKGLDSVCAMFHNRRECITFKKLKPAVQRMLRKNFTETHLAQIKHVYPEAFIFTQMKMRNYGSASKADYFQLVVSPNVENAGDKLKMGKIDEENVLEAAQSSAMNPHVMIERIKRFQTLLLQRVMNAHNKFLQSLDPPLSIPTAKVTRWHPDFDLEHCEDIECAALPQPPNVEKYSSARDILSTARNLFNCATPMERVMERYEAKVEADRVTDENRKNAYTAAAAASTAQQSFKPTCSVAASTAVDRGAATTTAAPVVPQKVEASPADANAQLLKGLPKSLLDKIRAKQAAKALDAMTRRPSQDHEASNYSRLPELARHLRNVFITERKGVLTLEIVIRKIQNSYRTCLTPHEIETHLRLIAKEMPAWVAFHEVRKTLYLKICKDVEMGKVVEQLEIIANDKAK